MIVDDDMVVNMAYVLTSSEGQEMDRSDEGIAFVQGHGQIVPGLEEALYGLGVGDEKEVVVEPEDGYGEYESDNVQEVPRDAFPAELDLQPGMALRLRDRNTGEEYVAYVVVAGAETVKLDYNHPLAGQTLHFHVEIKELRQLTAAEKQELNTA